MGATEGGKQLIMAGERVTRRTYAAPVLLYFIYIHICRYI